MKKKFIALCCAVCLVLSTNVFAFAQNTNVDKNFSESKTLKLDDSKTVVSDVLTFSQIVDEISKNNNITKSEASNQIISSFSKQDKNINTDINSKLTAKLEAQRATYRKIGTFLNVTDEYHPKLYFYCQTDEYQHSSFRAILKILNVGIYREDLNTGVTKQFGGTVYANLEDPNKIFYIVNGDFYNYGTTTVGGGVNIGVGQAATVNFNISNSKNHYKY